VPCWERGSAFALHHQVCTAVGNGSVRHLVLETIGARLSRPDLPESLPPPVHRRDLGPVTQTGSDVALSGHYCDRIQNDNSNNPAKVSFRMLGG